MSGDFVRRTVAWAILASPFVVVFGAVVVAVLEAGCGWYALAVLAGIAVFIWLFMWALHNAF